MYLIQPSPLRWAGLLEKLPADSEEWQFQPGEFAPSRTPAPCGTLPAVSLLTELDAFYLNHRRCGELEAGVDERVVWIACECGAAMARNAGEDVAE